MSNYRNYLYLCSRYRLIITYNNKHFIKIKNEQRTCY